MRDLNTQNGKRQSSAMTRSWREAVNSTVLLSSMVLNNDLIENWCAENGVDQPTGALWDPD
jgi:hypothetical protein